MSDLKKFGKSILYGAGAGLLAASSAIVLSIFSRSENSLISLSSKAGAAFGAFVGLPLLFQYLQSTLSKEDKNSFAHHSTFSRVKEILYISSFVSIAAPLAVITFNYLIKANNKWSNLLLGPIILGGAGLFIAHDYLSNEGSPLGQAQKENVSLVSHLQLQQRDLQSANNQIQEAKTALNGGNTLEALEKLNGLDTFITISLSGKDLKRLTNDLNNVNNNKAGESWHK